MSLPAPWVNELFGRLMLIYGRDFARRWEGMDIDAVKASWAYELGGFENHPEAITYALDRLPERPPNVLEFRALARMAPLFDTLLIEHKPADPATVKLHLARLTALSQKIRAAMAGRALRSEQIPSSEEA